MEEVREIAGDSEDEYSESILVEEECGSLPFGSEIFERLPDKPLSVCSQFELIAEAKPLPGDKPAAKPTNRVMELLARESWDPETPEHFSGTSFKNRTKMTLAQKLDVYKPGQPGFVEKITGLSEVEFLKKHRALYADKAKNDVQGVTIGELRTQYAAIPKPGAGGGKVEVVTGLDALKLVLSEASANSICQVASQFNGLESTKQDKATITSYATDFTQGPRSVMPCLNELIKREVSGFNAFDKMLSAEDRQKFIKNGYVQWGANPAEFLEKIKGKSNELQVLAMVARPELCGHSMLQVYAAAPPTDAYKNSGDKKVQLEIAKELVIPQYEALAMMAVIRAHKTGKPVDLNVTLVGAGAFANDPAVLNEALKKMMDIVKGHPVRLAIHAYKPSEVTKFEILKDIPKVTGEKFLEDRTPAK